VFSKLFSVIFCLIISAGVFAAAPDLTGISIENTDGYTSDSTPVITINSDDTATYAVLSCAEDVNKGWQAFDDAASDTIEDFDITVSEYGCLGGSDGMVTVYLKLKNDANESGTVSSSVTYDTSAPVSGINVPADGSSASALAIIEGTAEDDGSGVLSVEITITRNSDGYDWNGNGWGADETWVAAEGTTDWEYAVSITEAGEYTIVSKATDNLNNAETPAAEQTSTFTIDLSGPPISIKNVAGDTTSPYWDTSDESLTNLKISGEEGMVCWFDAEEKTVYTELTELCSTSGSEATCWLGDLDQNAYTYYYACVDNLDNNTDVFSVSFGVDWTAPAKVTGVSASVQSTSSIKIVWAEAPEDDISYYRIYRGTTEIGTVSEGTEEYTDTGLSSNTPYSYKVSAVDNAGNEGAQSEAASATTSTGTTPDTPVIKCDTHTEDVWTTNDDPRFTWDDVSGASEYRCSLTRNSDTTPTSTSGCDRDILFEDRENGVWYFHLKACADDCSSTDHYKIKIDGTSPSKPANFSVRLTSGKDIKLTWEPSSDSSSGMKEYRIYRHTASGFDMTNARKISTAGSDTEEYIDNDYLTDGKRYYYRIVAVDKAGNLSEVNEVSIKAEGKACDIELSTEPAEFVGTGEVKIKVSAGDKIYSFSVNSWILGVKIITPKKSGDAYEKTLSYTIDSKYNGKKLKIELYAEDADGDPCTLAKNLVIDGNSPVVSLAKPSDTNALKGTEELSAEASDIGSGIKEVNFYYKEGSEWKLIGKGIADGNLYSIDWDTASVANGNYRLKAVAEDEAGNTTEAETGITTDNTTPPDTNRLGEEKMEYTYSSADLNSLLMDAGLLQNLLAEASGLTKSCSVKRKLTIKPDGTLYSLEFVVTIRNNTGNRGNFQIIELIPKGLVDNVSLLEEGDFEVIAEDPVIKFVAYDVEAGEEISFSYRLREGLTEEEAEKLVEENAAELFKAPPVLLYAESEIGESFRGGSGSWIPSGLLGLAANAGKIVGIILILAMLGIAAVHVMRTGKKGKKQPVEGLGTIYANNDSGILSRVREKLDGTGKEETGEKGRFAWKD
jgi:hypothetical protein